MAELEGLEFLRANKIKGKPCDLERPFAFISYAHADIDEQIVRNVFIKLYDRGYNLWIDTANIPKDSRPWYAAANEALLNSENCKLALFFRSEESLVRPAIKEELENISAIKRIKGPVVIDIWHDESNNAKKYQLELINKPHKTRNENVQLNTLLEIYKKISAECNAIRMQDINSDINELCEEISEALEENGILPNKFYSSATSSVVQPVQAVAASAEGKSPVPVFTSAPVSAPVSAPAPASVSAPEPSNENKKRASTTGDITYTIYGKEYTDNQSNMMLNVFAKVLMKHPDAVAKILEDSEKPMIRCASAINYELPENKTDGMPSRYLAGQYLDVGGGIFIGTALNYPEKLRNIAQLLTICGEDFSVLRSEQIELPENVKSRASGGGVENYTIYGEEHSGNQTQMMIDTLKFIMEKHFDKREELAGLLSIKLAPMSELTPYTYFRSGEEFVYQGITYSIGTSFGRTDKLKQIRKAISICGEDITQFEIAGLNDPDSKNGAPNKAR